VGSLDAWHPIVALFMNSAEYRSLFCLLHTPNIFSPVHHYLVFSSSHADFCQLPSSCVDYLFRPSLLVVTQLPSLIVRLINPLWSIPLPSTGDSYFRAFPLSLSRSQWVYSSIRWFSSVLRRSCNSLW
jgi:hypothetical protein